MENLIEFVQQVCPNCTNNQIIEVFNMIRHENPSINSEELVDTAVGMLLGQSNTFVPPDEEQLWNDEEGASGFNSNEHFNNLISIFPDAKEEFVWNYCQQQGSNFYLSEAIDTFTNDGYERKVVDADAIWTRLKEALPFADPDYLKKEAEKLVYQDQNSLQVFVNAALENNDLPTMQDFLKRERESKKLSEFSTDFDCKQFLEIFPDPEGHFEDPNRVHPLSDPDVSQADLDYALAFLYNQYRKTRKRHIQQVFRMKQRRLWQCCHYLNQFPGGMRSERPEEPAGHSQNLELVQEVAYLKHRRLLRAQIKYRDQSYVELKEQARACNLLVTCAVCQTEELIPEECFCCHKGCRFCKECVMQYVQVRIGDGFTNFPCCVCDSDFDLHTLQLVLSHDPDTFEKLVLKIQSDQLQKARLDGLESCPFCDYTDVPPVESKIFICQNPNCGKNSCRLCRHESHVPLRCNEIEYDEDVRRRTHIENMMTEGLVRTCHKCGKKFVKSDGCNKMRCTCGSLMCYLCDQPITGYEHFGAPPRCQLFTNDVEINLNRVRTQAQKARNELGDVEIKFDPTVNLEQYYKV